MEQVKIFSDYFRDCEKAVNQWLNENAGKVKIVRVLQSSASYETAGRTSGMQAVVHISIFYQKKK